MSAGKVGEDTELSSGAAVGGSDSMTNQEQLESFYDSEGFLMKARGGDFE